MRKIILAALLGAAPGVAHAHDLIPCLNLMEDLVVKQQATADYLNKSLNPALANAITQKYRLEAADVDELVGIVIGQLDAVSAQSLAMDATIQCVTNAMLKELE